MLVDVTPPLEDDERRALTAALDLAALPPGADDPYGRAWRAAALREAVDGEAEADYAFSPRSTRGATRA